MTILQAIVFGIVQGIGEFLPISSTAHIILVPWLLGWKDPGNVFDVALHLGTAAAVILFFIKDWLRLIHAGFTHPKTTDGRLFWILVATTIPGGLAGVLLDKHMESLRNPAVIGVMLILMGVVLYAADKFGKREINVEHIGLKRGFIVGVSQAFAVIPGVSRSGVTISVGRLLGMTREGIARFTFLMSAPIILADGLYHAKDLGNVPIDKAPFITAILTSAIVGALSIKFLLNYLRNEGFGIFAVYRFVLGAAVIGIYFFRQ